ncbi:hypothetical protein GCM10027592_45740 [Spirosoma flavus]
MKPQPQLARITGYANEINNVGYNIGVDIRLEVLLAELLKGGLDPRREVMIYPQGLFSRSYRPDVGLSRAIPKPARPLWANKKLPNARYRIVLFYLRQAKAQRKKNAIRWHRIKFLFDKSGVWAGPIHVFEDDQPNFNLPEHPNFLNIPVFRDGLYDYLPEGLFHQRTEEDEREYAKEIDEQDRREQAARRFFRPIEQEFYLQGLLLELEERKYLITEENLQRGEQGAILRNIWGLPADRLVREPNANGSGWTTTRQPLFDIRQLNNLLHLLPVAHRLINDRSLIERVLELILAVPVELSTIPPLLIPIDLGPDDRVGPVELGQIQMGNFSLEGIYQDTMPAVEIRLGPLNEAQLTDFLPEGRSRAVLDVLISYFLPAETEIITHLLPDDENKLLKLAEDADSPTSVLGWASFI